MRICGDELIEHGTTIDDAVRVAQMVEATGQVDYVNTSIGVATASLFVIEASMHIPPGYAMYIPSAIRKAIDLPVVGVGRFKDPLQAERALAEGHCDLVGVVRGQIADAEFAAKARAGATDEIRLCLSCNQECVGRMGLNRWLGCIENPHTGREALLPAPRATPARPQVGAPKIGARSPVPDRPASRPRSPRPATGTGSRCANRARTPAGQVRLAASVPNRAELGDMIRNQLTECRRLGVTIEYGVGVWPGLVAERRPDHVIVATGAEPQRPWWVPRGCDHRRRRPRRARRRRCDPFGDVMVIDEIGFHHATSVAELLADRGCAVEIVTPGMVVGQDLGVTLDMENWWIRANDKGIVQRTDLVPMGMDGQSITLLHHPTGEHDHELAGLGRARRAAASGRVALPRARRRDGVSVERIGDCVAPRRAHAAVVEGERAGSTV